MTAAAAFVLGCLLAPLALEAGRMLARLVISKWP